MSPFSPLFASETRLFTIVLTLVRFPKACRPGLLRTIGFSSAVLLVRRWLGRATIPLAAALNTGLVEALACDTSSSQRSLHGLSFFFWRDEPLCALW